MTAKEPISISKPRLLIGEGLDEVRMFGALLKHAGLESQIQILAYDGKGNLGPFLRTLKNLSGFNQLESLGVTRDADADATDASKSVAAFLRDCARRMRRADARSPSKGKGFHHKGTEAQRSRPRILCLPLCLRVSVVLWLGYAVKH